MWRSIDLINAYIHFTYGDDEDVIICDNSKLNDPAFRFTDKVHLSDAGTSVLASNLKYSIAEALNVKVIKKPPRGRDSDRRRFARPI